MLYFLLWTYFILSRVYVSEARQKSGMCETGKRESESCEERGGRGDSEKRIKVIHQEYLYVVFLYVVYTLDGFQSQKEIQVAIL